MRQRLLNLAHARGQPLELLLTRYALERLLHRLSLSPHRNRFVLKGALLVTTWFDEPHRATRDLDLLGFGDPSEDALVVVFREVMAIMLDDGVSFDTAKLQIQPIREGLEYGGSRLRTTAALAGARIPIVVDVGFGDAVEPGVEDIDLPVLLDLPSPRLRAYPPETVIAEKLHAIVILGLANSRMKDYYDVWMLLRRFELDPGRLRRAIEATFARRITPLPTAIPEGLSDAFAEDPGKQALWQAFSRNLSAPAPTLSAVVADLRAWLSAAFTPE
ncbi:nucleotidyl transferase AbiEii/AbiGii toxin family protein [Ramlibacter sp.]|uniref:nucleotidyl transferase AbiEii/AbiGii toxin family protein n=1 Tax=Ramlibacter sp. TaxID=1917967 RepID=UPI002628EDC6|nr:nucleotidyl transferase AbiEii/AbiGii toxin family protein [Ramlibacter sp.]